MINTLDLIENYLKDRNQLGFVKILQELRAKSTWRKLQLSSANASIATLEAENKRLKQENLNHDIASADSLSERLALLKKNKGLLDAISKMESMSKKYWDKKKEADALELQNKKLRHCVEFYADEKEWKESMLGLCDKIDDSDFETEPYDHLREKQKKGHITLSDYNFGGKRARKCLEELKDKQ